jgi:hypothetical protein
MNGRRHILLACECEWGTGSFGKTSWARVENEFEKLLPVKAPFKVLIFSSCSKSNPSEPDTDFSFGHARRRIENCLRSYGHHVPGEVYIFLDLPQTRKPDENGRYKSLIWLSKKLGRQKVSLKVGPDGDLCRP